MPRCSVRFATLADYLDGKLAAGDAEAVREHFNTGCADCRQRLGALKRIHGALAAEPLVRAPLAALAQARALGRERLSLPRRSVVAQLIFDSRTAPAFAGARGAGESAHQALFRTEDHDIDLWQEPQQDGRWYLIGQVLPRSGGGPAPVESALLRSAQWEGPAALEHDEFHFDATPEGAYALHVTLAGWDIIAPDVRVGP